MKAFVRSLFCLGRCRWPVRIVPAFLFVVLSMPQGVSGQTTTGRVLGSVHDAQDAAIVGAKVTVTDTQRNTVRTAISDENGEYLVADLQPSTYKVQIEAKGFNSYVAVSVLIEVDKDVRLDVSLKTGDSTQVITVNEAPAMLDTTNSMLGGTLSNK
ncbi:MAG: carboxypeptidase-like regulatory domain-containing protein, partial [Candidatus Acidiferrum sp.]